METKELFGMALPPDVQNPFQKECITYISLTARPKLFSGEWTFEGYVKFKAGNTEGRQEFYGSNLAEVYNKILNFCLLL